MDEINKTAREGLLIIGSVCIFLVSCISLSVTAPTSTPVVFQPPDYIKRLDAHREGDALLVSFMLGDESGNATVAKGRAEIEVWESGMTRGFPIHYQSFTITEKDFHNNVCSLGRLKYDSFKWAPDKDKRGTVKLMFTTNGGKKMLDETSVVF